MMRLLNIILLVEFIVSVTDIYLEEKGITTIPGAWLVVFVVLTGSVPLIYFLWATGKNKG